MLHYKSEYCLMDIFMLFPQSFIRVWFFWESRLQHQFIWWIQVLWTFWIFLKLWNFKILWKFWIFIFNFRILKFVENLEIFEIFWKFWIFLKFLNFVKISEFSLIDDEVRVFRINIKLLSNPVAELKIRENDSHCRSIVLTTMDRSISKQAILM